MYLDEYMKRKTEIFRKRIIDWYHHHGDKSIPWRNTENAWYVLVATFLLKKTTTKQVLKIYPKFIEKFPNPFAVLNSTKDEIKELIRPLGIEHQRAELIIRLARHLVNQFKGEIPCRLDELKKLPGVGNYTASEVLLVACKKPEALLDRNMIRIIVRVFGVMPAKKRPHTDQKLWAFAKMLVPKDPDKAKAFNYGVLDFARKICTARNPKCNICPIADICDYHSKNKHLNTLKGSS